MQTTNERMTEEQLTDLLNLAAELQAKAEASNDRDTAVMAYAVQKVCVELTESRLKSKASEQQLAAVVAENTGLKSNLMFWDADNPELPYEHPDEIAMECEIAYDDTFEVQVAARMPNRKYRVVIMTDDDCQTEQVVSEEIQTPATDAFLAEARAQGVDLFALMFAEEAIKSNNITTGWRAKASRAASEYAEALREDAAQLRKGAAL